MQTAICLLLVVFFLLMNAFFVIAFAHVISRTSIMRNRVFALKG